MTAVDRGTSSGDAVGVKRASAPKECQNSERIHKPTRESVRLRNWSLRVDREAVGGGSFPP